jgi:Flp pilus assembly protein TadG
LKPNNQDGSAVVDFILTSFGLLAIFVSALTVISNLYLRTVLTNVATDAARQISRADQTGAEFRAIDSAQAAVHAIVGDSLKTVVTAKTETNSGFSLAVVTISANLPGLPLFPGVTAITTKAHATAEIQ